MISIQENEGLQGLGTEATDPFSAIPQDRSLQKIAGQESAAGEQTAPNSVLMEAINGFEAFLQEKKVEWPYSASRIAQLATFRFRAPSLSIGYRLLRHVAKNNLLPMEEKPSRKLENRFFFHRDAALVFGALIRELPRTPYDPESHSAQEYFDKVIMQVKKRLGSDPLAHEFDDLSSQPSNQKKEVVVFAGEQERRASSRQAIPVVLPVETGEEKRKGQGRGRPKNPFKVPPTAFDRRILYIDPNDKNEELARWGPKQLLQAFNDIRAYDPHGPFASKLLPIRVAEVVAFIYAYFNGQANNYDKESVSEASTLEMLMGIRRVIRLLEEHPKVRNLLELYNIAVLAYNRRKQEALQGQIT